MVPDSSGIMRYIYIFIVHSLEQIWRIFWNEITTDNVEINLEKSFDIEENHVKEKQTEIEAAFEEINSPEKVEFCFK